MMIESLLSEQQAAIQTKLMTDFGELVHEMRRKLSGYAKQNDLVDSIVIPTIRTIIHEAKLSELNHSTTENLIDKYFSPEIFPIELQKPILDQIRILVTACYVLIAHNHLPSVRKQFWTSSHDLMSRLGSEEIFYGISEEEQMKLVRYRNYMVAALQAIPARNNKTLLLSIVPRLAGYPNCITGGKQTKAVKRLVRIYEHEGCVKPKPRKRKLKDAFAPTTVTFAPSTPSSASTESKQTDNTSIEHIETSDSDVSNKRKKEDDSSISENEYDCTTDAAYALIYLKSCSWPYSCSVSQMAAEISRVDSVMGTFTQECSKIEAPLVV